MTASPGDQSEDRRPLPPFAPALSRPTPGVPSAGAGGSPFPPFAPFVRPPEPAASAPAEPAAPSASRVIEEYAPAVGEQSAPVTEPEEEWMPWEEEATPAAEVPVDAGGGEEEAFPWIATDETGAAPASAAESTVTGEEAQPGAAVDEGELPGWLSWADEEEEAAPVFTGAESAAPVTAAEPTVPEESTALPVEVEGPGSEVMEPWAEPATEAAPEPAGAATIAAPEVTPDVEGVFAASEAAAVEEAYSAPAVEYGAEESSGEPVAATAGDARGAHADAFAEVADRLERIVRSLRENPSEVLAGGEGRDPLELLVTGFVLGYAQGRNRGA
ncbi:MAG TPA: hypothetical protein VHG28_00580 [Longimicrobiaceae bacterium]|nr:hypothetical protein [Longimicrobiaceae bacterium]